VSGIAQVRPNPSNDRDLKLRIAMLSSNVECVPPQGYGGTELVVSMLTEELVRRGHQVTLFGSGDSQTSARLVSVTDTALRKLGEPARRWHAYDIRLLMELQKRRTEFDIVHNHMGWQALPYLEAMDCPVVTTNHNPIKDYAAPIYMVYRHLPYVAISEAYRQRNYPVELNYVATIYNGIDLSDFDGVVEAAAREYLLFIGRLCEDKGTAPAIEIARRLQLQIVLAGKVDEADRGYFENQVKPHINPPHVEFVGEVDHRAKVELYRKAIATVYPINFDEPFGLVMAESLAAGTPVMAFDRGSVREVLSDGDTAVIAHDVEELIQRFGQIQEIRPENCKQRVQDLFSKERMVDQYLEVYRLLISERPRF
jgi:glycosyltransferase involved in cell wall biosynthesis